MSLRIALRPPIRFAEPGSAWIVVMPPAMANGICGSWGQNECSAQTSAVMGFVASLPSDSASVPGAAYTPRCEWSSIKPGVTYFPVPSTTATSAGASTFSPTATIRPSLSRMDPLRISCPVAVMMVALRISTGGLGPHHAARRRRAHVHHKRHARARHGDMVRLKRPGRDDHALLRADLEREQLHRAVAGREEAHREALSRFERKRRNGKRDCILVDRAGRQHRVDVERLGGPVLLRHGAPPFHPSPAVG